MALMGSGGFTSYIIPKDASNTIYAIQDVSGNNAAVNTTAQGQWVAVRTGTTASALYLNGVS
jgi:hypothetical protein